MPSFKKYISFATSPSRMISSFLMKVWGLSMLTSIRMRPSSALCKNGRDLTRSLAAKRHTSVLMEEGRQSRTSASSKALYFFHLRLKEDRILLVSSLGRRLCWAYCLSVSIFWL